MMHAHLFGWILLRYVVLEMVCLAIANPQPPRIRSRKHATGMFTPMGEAGVTESEIIYNS